MSSRKRTEPTEKERIKAALLRNRDAMRRKRHEKEMDILYEGNLCVICHHRHMTGVICRKHKGPICERHCRDCEHFQPMFFHCMYRETEPIDMRKWRMVYGCRDKGELWRGLYFRELVLGDGRGRAALSEEESEAVSGRAMDIIAARPSPKYIVRDEPDENGDHAIVDADTGEIHPFVAKFLEEIPAWVCVEYLPPGM